LEEPEGIDLRVCNQVVVPFYRLTPPDAVLLPLRSVILGAGAQKVDRPVRLLLWKHGYKDIQILNSKIPLRCSRILV